MANSGIERAAEWLGPKIYRGKTVKDAANAISSPLLVTTMVMVGNTFLLPVKWLENRKPGIVRGMHEKDVAAMEAAGTPYSEEERARQEKALKDLENEPPQSWASLLGGRVAGLVPVFALAFALGEKGQHAERFAAKTISKGLETVGAKQLAKSKTLESYIHVGFLDVFYSMISAGGLYVYSHMVHPKDKDPKHKESLSELLPGATPAGAIVDATPTTGMSEIPETPESAVKQRKFSEAIERRDPTAIPPRETRKAKPSPESYRQKLAVEEVAQENRSAERSSL
ncbi:MAG: hypothetical protein EBV03_04720 [Proteobacteria bacterium]|nr:hypothetical protein [Pseudomonadota bacterium]